MNSIRAESGAANANTKCAFGASSLGDIDAKVIRACRAKQSRQPQRRFRMRLILWAHQFRRI